jgi:hypothetical protein
MLTPAEQAYFAEIAAQLVSTHGERAPDVLAADPVAAVQAAHEARQAFVVEFLHQRTERVRLAKELLLAEVYGRAVLTETRRRALERCENIADYNYRRAFGIGFDHADD